MEDNPDLWRFLDKAGIRASLDTLGFESLPVQHLADPYAGLRGKVRFEKFATHYTAPIVDGRLVRPADRYPPALFESLVSGQHLDPRPTPRRTLVPALLARTLAEVHGAVAAAAGDPDRPDLVVAYSTKTNPMPEVITAIRDAGLLIETITADEVAHALRLGVSPDRIVVNGPAKFWPAWPLEAPVDALFADNPAEVSLMLERQRAGAPLSRVFGFRLRPAAVTSRFGLDVSDPAVRRVVIGALQDIDPGVPIGFHFHFSSGFLGTAGWWLLCATFLESVRSLCAEAGRTPDTIDLGGGWVPGDWSSFLAHHLPMLGRHIAQMFPSVTRLVLEPGGALVQEAMVLETRIIQLNRIHGRLEAICDGSGAELWDTGCARQLFLARQAPEVGPPELNVRRLGAGRDVLLGRLCMEDDILADGIALPPDLTVGDLIWVTDAGAYSCSRAYAFGSGAVA